MKNFLSLLLFSLLGKTMNAQYARFAWAKQMGGSGNGSIGNSITTDASGNIYTTGFFQGMVDFDPGTGIFDLTSSSSNSLDIFITKLDPDGNLVWAKQIGAETGTGSGAGITIAVDPAGNVYTYGFFKGIFDMDPGPNIFTLTGSTGATFISKLDANGNFSWAKQIDAEFAIERDHAMTVDKLGNVFLTGSFGGTIDFDPGPGIFNLMSGGSGLARDMFICKLNTAGAFIWAKQIGGLTTIDGADGFSIVTDAAGNIYTSGNYNGTVDFDPGVGVSNINGSGTFLSKLDQSGNFLWAEPVLSKPVSDNNTSSIALDPQGNILASGDNFLFKFDKDGSLIWQNEIGGTGLFIAYSLCTDVNGNVYTTGFFTGSVKFQPSACAYDYISYGEGDDFISAFDAAGNFIWAKQIGGAGLDVGNSIATDNNGNIYSTGYFSASVDFDPGNKVYMLNSIGKNDIFVQKLSTCTNNTNSALKISACGAYELNCQTYPSSGIYTQHRSNVEGCDSIITLDLTILKEIPRSVESKVACTKYLWNGKFLDSTGEYADTLRTLGGCDSIAILNLTINLVTSFNISQVICNGQSFSGYTKTGTYVDTLMNANGCDSIRTIQLLVQKAPLPDLGKNTIICQGSSLTLYPGEYDNYQWQDGSTQNKFTVSDHGFYSVEVSNHCGSAQAGVRISEIVCNILFPSAFTPNKDGKNETFKILNTPVLTDYHLSIFNRWGEKVFETREYTRGWDGNINGLPSETGAYAWFCEFKKPGDNHMDYRKGTVLLLR